MPFGQTFESIPVTNLDEKKEKNELMSELAAIKAEISAHNEQKEVLLGAAEVIPDRTKELEILDLEISAKKQQLDKIYTDIAVEDKKHTTAVMQVIGKTTKSSELDEEIKKKEQELLSLAGKIMSVGQQQQEIDKKIQFLTDLNVSTQKQKLELETEITELQKNKTSETARLTEIKRDRMFHVEQHNTLMEEILNKNTKLAKLHEEVLKKQAEAELVIAASKERAEQIIQEAQTSIKLRQQQLDEYSGEISLRESWNREHEENLKALKAELEKHLGKTIKINFSGDNT